VTALAAALAEMVAGYARRSGTVPDLTPLVREMRAARHRALRLADADAVAYAEYTRCQAEHRANPSAATRRARESSLDSAAAAPAELVDVAAGVIDAAGRLHRAGAPALRPDASTAALLAAAGCRAAAEFVAGNLAGRRDDVRFSAARNRAVQAIASADALAATQR
jgi:formiminotetrahydrofolate cyclodeaminase